MDTTTTDTPQATVQDAIESRDPHRSRHLRVALSTRADGALHAGCDNEITDALRLTPARSETTCRKCLQLSSASAKPRKGKKAAATRQGNEKKTGRAPSSSKTAGAWTAPKPPKPPTPAAPDMSAAAVKRRAFARLQAGGFTSELITDYLAGDMRASQRWDDAAERFIPVEALRFDVSDAEAEAAGLLLRHVLQLENQTDAFEAVVHKAIDALAGVKL